jgi:hypothetical protein
LLGSVCFCIWLWVHMITITWNLSLELYNAAKVELLGDIFRGEWRHYASHSEQIFC